MVIGAAAGAVCHLAVKWASNRKRFDDSFGVWPCHSVGGALGMLLVGVFAHYTINPTGLTAQDGSHLNGLIFGDASLLLYQVIAVLATVSFTMVVTYGLALFVRRTVGLRVPEDQEDSLGLDLGFDAAAFGP